MAKCPHCGHEIANGSEKNGFDLVPPTPRRKPTPKHLVLGEGDTIIRIPAIGGECEVRASIVQEWTKTYPAVDVPATLGEILDWQLGHMHKRKSNVRAFISGWLKREQDRG